MLEYFKNPYLDWDKGKRKRYELGFCYVLYLITDFRVHIYDLPELMKYKPVIFSSYALEVSFWFARNEAGYFKRQFMLMAAIEETKLVTK